MVVMTGQQVIDFIRQHKLKDAEVEIDNMDFTIDLPDDTWLEYDIEDEDVKHYPNPDEWQIGPDVISYEEAMNLRFPKKESLRPRRYRILVTNGNYTVPETLMTSLTDAFRERFSDLCSEPGKSSTYKEKISFYKDIIYVLATKENFNKILEQIEYERVPSVPPVGRTHYIFKGFKEEEK